MIKFIKCELFNFNFGFASDLLNSIPIGCGIRCHLSVLSVIMKVG